MGLYDQPTEPPDNSMYEPRCERCKQEVCECCIECGAGPEQACEPQCGFRGRSKESAVAMKLSQEELNLCSKLGTCFGDFCALPRQHPMELAEFCDAIHVLQSLVMCRLAQRVHPETFSQFPPEPTKPAADAHLGHRGSE